MPKARKRICYFHDDEIGNYHYGHGHPMKPQRTQMTHDLLEAYGITNQVERMVPDVAESDELTRFHADDYIEFLQTISTANTCDFKDQMNRFNVGEDCPVFDGLWEYCQSYSGGTLGAAHHLSSGQYDFALNWSGGMHHGKKHEASGFCYVNDCVLGCLELLKHFHRVLYIDIDIHHGDGVEEAFYTTPRAMTLSFHKYGDYFPGTGHIQDIGVGEGLGYAVNVPLRDGIDDELFQSLFSRVTSEVLERYQPQAIVLQSGADSLSGDRLGCFNLSLSGHSCPSRFLRDKGIPLMLLGGGGYTLRNVPKCWANETAVLLGVELSPKIPEAAIYSSYYAPDYLLAVRNSNMHNLNTKSSLDDICETISENLHHVHPVGAHISGVFATDDNSPVRTIRPKHVEEENNPDQNYDNAGEDENEGNLFQWLGLPKHVG